MEKNSHKRSINWARYVIALVITVAIFATVFYVSNLATNKRLDEMKSMQDKITVDLLSSETQFSLLNTAGCTDDGSSILAPEIGEMADRLSYMENQLGADNSDVIGLKEYYSLLEIKDYLLVSALAQKCHTKPITIIYFYSNDDDCADCTKQGYVLTALRNAYPDLRVYSFDADLDLSAIKTLQTITKVPSTLPSLVINGKVYSGFQTIDQIEKAIPDLAKIEAENAASKTTGTTTATLDAN